MPSHLYLAKRLSDILGFVKTGPFAAGDRKSENLSNIEDGTHYMHVYCDLIEPVALGKAKVPLLRIVPIQKGPIVTTSYNQVFYNPVIKKFLGAVEIYIQEKLFHLLVGTIHTIHIIKQPDDEMTTNPLMTSIRCFLTNQKYVSTP